MTTNSNPWTTIPHSYFQSFYTNPTTFTCHHTRKHPPDLNPLRVTLDRLSNRNVIIKDPSCIVEALGLIDTLELFDYDHECDSILLRLIKLFEKAHDNYTLQSIVLAICQKFFARPNLNVGKEVLAELSKILMATTDPVTSSFALQIWCILRGTKTSNQVENEKLNQDLVLYVASKDYTAAQLTAITQKLSTIPELTGFDTLYQVIHGESMNRSIDWRLTMLSLLKHFAQTNRHLQQIADLWSELEKNHPHYTICITAMKNLAYLAKKFPSSCFCQTYKTNLLERQPEEPRAKVFHALSQTVLFLIDLYEVKEIAVVLDAVLERIVTDPVITSAIALFLEGGSRKFDLSSQQMALCKEQILFRGSPNTTTKPRVLWYLGVLSNHCQRELASARSAENKENYSAFLELLWWVQVESCSALAVGRVRSLCDPLPQNHPVFCFLLPTLVDWFLLAQDYSTQTPLLKYIVALSRSYHLSLEQGQKILQYLCANGTPVNDQMVLLSRILFAQEQISPETILQKTGASTKYWIHYSVLKEAMIRGLPFEADAFKVVSDRTMTEGTLFWFTALSSLAAAQQLYKNMSFFKVVEKLHEVATALSAAASIGENVAGWSFSFQITFIKLVAQTVQLLIFTLQVSSIAKISVKRTVQQSMEKLRADFMALADKYTRLYRLSFGCDADTLATLQGYRELCAILIIACTRSSSDSILSLPPLEATQATTSCLLHRVQRIHAFWCANNENKPDGGELGAVLALLMEVPLQIPRSFFRMSSVCQGEIRLTTDSGEICIRHGNDFSSVMVLSLKSHQSFSQIHRVMIQCAIRSPDGTEHHTFKLEHHMQAADLLYVDSIRRNEVRARLPFDLEGNVFPSKGSFVLHASGEMIEEDGQEWTLPTDFARGIVVY